VPPFIPITAVIELTFAPVLTIGDWTVRLATIALAAVVLASLVVAVLIARRTPVDLRLPANDFWVTEGEDPNHLRADDLLYIAVASLPGAVAGGRLGYLLLHLDYYRANPSSLLDASRGGLQLSLAVVGGTATAILIAALLGAPIRRWLHALTLPLLFAIAAGKATLALAGDGQGLPFDGSWATAYPGDGPWGSLAPALPSHPAQLYEALATAAVLVVLMVILAAGGFRRRDGRAFLVGLGLWAAARAAVAATWRDPAVLGPLNMDQVISIAIAMVSLGLVAAVPLVARRRRAGGGSGRSARAEPDWPDPGQRPRF
jgi:phosphatidylglycerol:prolipoprotein diacylglycerol transferase